MSEFTQPVNRNFLSELNYKLIVPHLPTVEFTVVRAIIPEMNMLTAITPTPFSNIPQPGTKSIHKPLRVTYKVDEDLKNYKEVYDWFSYISLKTDFLGYNALTKDTTLQKGVKSNVILTTLTSAKNANKSFTFHDAFPVGISELRFDSTQTDVLFLEHTVSFEFTYFSLD
jgi:hypothetical protein